MATRVIFQDPIYQFPNRYRFTDLGGGLYEIASEPGVITQEGTLLSSSNLNATAEEVIFNVTDTSDAANAFVCTINNLSAYYENLSIILKSKTTNTGAATINISNAGVKSIKKIDLNGNKINVQANDIIKNKHELLVFDGIDFVLSNPSADLATLITDLNSLKIKVNTIESDVNTLKNKIINFGVTTGSNNAYVLNISGITSYYAGLQINAVASFNNVGTSTLKINNLDAKVIKFNGNNLENNYIKQNQIFTVIYDGVNWQLNPTQGIASQIQSNVTSLSNNVSDLSNELGEGVTKTIALEDAINTIPDIVNGTASLEIEGNTLVNLLPNVKSNKWTSQSAVITNDEVELIQDGTNEYFETAVNLKNSTSYTLIYEVISQNLTGNFVLSGEPTTIVEINTSIPKAIGKNSINIITTSNATTKNRVKLALDSSNLQGEKIKFKNIMLIETSLLNNKITQQYFEGIKSIDSISIKSLLTNAEKDKIDILSELKGDKALKRLPNGVLDIYHADGVVDRKIGSFLWNGIENWQFDRINQYNIVNFIYYISSAKPFSSTLSDKFNAQQSLISETRTEGILCGNGEMYLRILKSTLIPYGFIEGNTTTYISALKAWLQVNPTTVIYELATPIQENINIPLFLQVFKNGSITVDSPIPATVNITYPTNIKSAIDSNSNAIANNRDSIKTVTKNIGDLSDLQTTNKDNIVGAVNELFINANNGKQNWVDVIGSPLLNTDTFSTLKDKTQALKNTMAADLTSKGQISNGSESLNSLIDKIKNINVGKKFTSGLTEPSTSGYNDNFISGSGIRNLRANSITVTGLNFVPSLILLDGSGHSDTNATHSVTVMFPNIIPDTGEGRIIMLDINNGYLANTSTTCFKLDGIYAYSNSNGFKLPVTGDNTAYNYIAIE